MGLVNKSKDATPFDMRKKPVRQSLPIAWLLWGASFLMTGRRLKIEKSGMENLKPPFLVLSTHQGFSDYFIAPRALFPERANYVSDVEGFAAYGKWLYRAGGCIGKRRYVPDVSVMQNIKYALFTLKQPVVIFPESRHSDAGVTSTLPDNLGKLAKHLGVPLVILSVHGSYLATPFWDEAHKRKVRMSAKLEKLYDAEELRRLSADEIQSAVEQKLSYDEYRWQLENKIEITYQNRGEGLHLPLYRCRECQREGVTANRKSRLFCTACGAAWEMTALGYLENESTGEKIHIPAWYRWEREQVGKEIREDRYAGVDIPVRIEALFNEKGFIKLGSGRLKHGKEGYALSLDEESPLGGAFPLRFPSNQTPSVQTEYDYRKKGKCIVLSTADCCYYVYSSAPEFLVTRLEFATEILYEKNRINHP